MSEVSEASDGAAGAGEAASAAGPTVVVVEARGVERTYESAAGGVPVLQGVDLCLRVREALAIVGASGAGKSTLLHLLGGLDRPTAGQVTVGGRSVVDLPSDELAAVRNRQIGFVFQFHHLLREFSALENVMMPGLIAGRGRRESRDRARALLAEVGLGHREGHRPGQLSGGEQQRAAVARALVNEPVVLLADEPSGNLDHHTSEHLHDLLFRLREDRGLAMILVTHNAALAHRADRILKLEDGVVHELGDGEVVPGWQGSAIQSRERQGHGPQV